MNIVCSSFGKKFVAILNNVDIVRFRDRVVVPGTCAWQPMPSRMGGREQVRVATRNWRHLLRLECLQAASPSNVTGTLSSHSHSHTCRYL